VIIREVAPRRRLSLTNLIRPLDGQSMILSSGAPSFTRHDGEELRHARVLLRGSSGDFENGKAVAVEPSG
jgi:hypothetical protein